MSGITEEQLNEIERNPYQHNDTLDSLFTLIAEIRRLRAENAELRSQREKQSDMIRQWNPLYR